MTMKGTSSQSASSNSSIRPVTSKFPSSESILDGSNLPFSVCITPLMGGTEDGSATGSNGNSSTTIRSLAGIPKCIHCGAAHASPDTHYVVAIPSGVVVDEDEDQEDEIDMASMTTPPPSYILICYLCARTAPLKNYKEPTPDAGSSLLPSSSLLDNTTGPSATNSSPKVSSMDTFQLPLRLQNQQNTPIASPIATAPIVSPIITNKAKKQNLIPKPMIYEIDAMACPPLWFIVLDGSCTNRLYWMTVSSVLQRCIKECPDHVHVSLMISCTSRKVVEEDNIIATGKKSVASKKMDNSIMEVHTLGVYQLTSAIPYVVHLGSDDTESSEEDLLLGVINSLVPATDAQYRTYIETAVRSLMDYQPPSAFNSNSSSSRSTTASLGGSGSKQSHYQYNCPVAWTTEVISAALQTAAVPAGQRPIAATTTITSSIDNPNISTIPDGGNTVVTTQRLPYAGGKITYLLANRPTSVSDTAKTCTMVPNNNGGFGGRIYNTIGERYSRSNGEQQHGTSPKSRSTTNNTRSTQSSQTVATDESDLTPNNLWQRYDPEEGIVQYYSELGRQCAELAVGVDILALTEPGSVDVEHNYDTASTTQTVPDFGLSLISPLSSKSGAPGPLMFEMFDDSSNKHQHQHTHPAIASNTATNERLLYRELISRTPWQPNMVFGSELRIRFSPGFGVDSTPVSPIPTSSSRYKNTPTKSRHRRTSSNASLDSISVTAPQLAPLYSESGMMGPGFSESEHLWRMGTCDPYTSVAIDLCIVPNVAVKNEAQMAGFGAVPFCPVIQTCFAYTTIVPSPLQPTGTTSTQTQSEGSVGSGREQKKGKYLTVRRMRISSHQVPLAHDVESLYSSLDLEALVVTLFHKLALAILQDGIQDGAALAQQWLQLLLKCVYRSAEGLQSNLERLAEKGIDVTETSNGDEDGPSITRPSTFFPNERLLDRDGELEWTEVVLAQGHPRLKSIVLMIYSLLQCDALRRYPAPATISIDLRTAALLQMSTMTPTLLMRSVVPTIQLWESGEDILEPVVDKLDLRTESVQLAVMEYWFGSGYNANNKRDLILLINAPDQIVVMDARSIVDSDSTSKGMTDPHGKNSNSKSQSKTSLVIGRGLRKAIDNSVRNCRTKPTIVYDFDQQDTSKNTVLRRLIDYLIEDTTCIALSSISGGATNFSEWRTYVAKSVRRQIEGNLNY